MILCLVPLIPLAGAIASLAPVRRSSEASSLASSLALFITCSFLLEKVRVEKLILECGEELLADELSVAVLFTISIVFLFASVYSIKYVDKLFVEGRFQRKKLYYFLLQLFTMTMVSTCLMNNLFLLWVAIEATTLASAFLIAIKRDPVSLEAAWKYVILCTCLLYTSPSPRDRG